MSAAAMELPKRTRDAQGKATRPDASAWVSANAGSGKTYVLSRRVIRLLLGGCDPGRILCLTFTKAAAAEMANRVFSELGRWATMPDGELADAILALEDERPSPARAAAARRLFAEALETPGGLKIQTIHGFCEALLQRFPLEANVPARFSVLDEMTENAWLAEARARMLREAAAEPGGEAGRAFATLLAAMTDATLDKAILSVIAERDGFRGWIAAAGDLTKALHGLAKRLGVDPLAFPDLPALAVAQSPDFTQDFVSALVGRLEASGALDQGFAQRLREALAATDAEGRAASWVQVFQTDRGEWRKKLCTDRIHSAFPDLAARYEREKARLAEAIEHWKAAANWRLTAALMSLADRVLQHYEAAKARSASLDYDDLIHRTRSLLSRRDGALWVQYKLDQGLDHVLVDEAQDTSPAQWDVVRALTEEFFAGMGAREGSRTIFAVGDEKQSIYSFQGAVPAWFDRMRRRFETNAKNARHPFARVTLDLSFRSSPDILGAVDAVFASPAAHDGLASEPVPTVHTAIRRHDPGLVEIWPVVEPMRFEEPEDWALPIDRLGAQSPPVRLAGRIAATIRGWIDDRVRLEGTGKLIRPGDVLILVRKRGAFVDAVNRALKAAGLPVAGVDRLVLTRHIAVMDLMALARVALLPQDDLALATLLRSPLIGVSEQTLFALAHDRPASLIAALRDSEDPALAEARDLVAEWRARADFLDPHAFFARVLGEGGARRRMRARLGPEADDVLDEFLALALAYERDEAPSLEGFLAYLAAGEREIAREVDMRRDEIRVMTVHGAKGLEAPVVFLVDPGSLPVHAAHEPCVVALDDDGTAPAPFRVSPLVWAPTRERRPKPVDDALRRTRDAAAAEYRRLLYVGMTRAKDRLIVTALKGPGTGNGCWHDLVCAALRPGAEEIVTPDGDIAWRWRRHPGPARPPAPEEASAPPLPPPPWFPKPIETLRPVPTLAPSSALRRTEEDGKEGRAPFPARHALAEALAPSTALQRGRLVHRLLEALPELAPEAREAAARRFLAAHAKDWSETDRAGLAAEVLAILTDARFGAVFAPGSRAEVPLAGLVTLAAGGPARVSGQVDRIAVSEDRVLLVDYKTDRPCPAAIGDVPEPYLAQVATYRRLLAAVYAGKRVEAALLFTAAPMLLPIPDARLDALEARLFAPD